jgi:hypothetical protein
MLNPSADWLEYIPVPGLPQVWKVLNSDTVLQSDACVSYSTVDSIETQFFQQTGIRVQFSRRWLAFISGTTLQGNTITNVFNALAKYGPVLETSWPQNNAMTWDAYYAAPTQAQLAALTAEGAQWKKVLNFQAPKYGIMPSELTSYLQKAPVIAFIPAVNPDHAVEVVNLTTMFNSEPASSNPLTEFIQPFSVAQGNSFHQIIIETTMNPNVETMNYNGTIGVFVPVSTPAEIPTLNAIFGTTLVAAADGSIATSKTVVDKA